MRKILIIIFLLPILLVGQTPTSVVNRSYYTAAIVPTWTNLFVWYDLTEISGNPLDLHTNGYDLTNGGTQTSDGIEFDGIFNYATNINLTTVGTTETFLLWVKPDGEIGPIFGGNAGAFDLFLTAGYALQAGLSDGARTSSTSITLTNGVWNFVSVVINGSSIRFGVNGSYETETWSLTPTDATDYLATSVVGGSADYLKVVLKGWSWFTDAKSDAYVTAFYNSGSGTDYEDGDPTSVPTWTNLISWWKLTETSGGTSFDSAPTGDDGTIVGDVSQTSSGVVFDGSGDQADYITIAGTSFGTGDFTIIFRVIATAGVVYRNWLGGTTAALQLPLYNNSKPRAMPAGSGGTDVTVISVNNGSESMVALVRSGSNFRFFIDGSFETETLSADFTSPLVKIGSSGYDYVDAEGTMRDLVMFSDAKSDSYITAFYNSGSYTAYEDGDPE